jgi:UDP-2-acetamido-3-amino-2,3-dideoxy-glucuronate N-acetyltransferase
MIGKSDRPVVFVHPSAEVSPGAVLGDGTRVWNQAQVREGAVLGRNVIVSKNVYIAPEVSIGSFCKIQNNVSLYTGVTVEDGVFLGPHVCFTNDRIPRAINTDGSQKVDNDWRITPPVVRHGASVGAHSVILPGVTIGRFAMVGAGSVVTHDVPDHGLVVGNPARLVGHVCSCGKRLASASGGEAVCSSCGARIVLGD